MRANKDAFAALDAQVGFPDRDFQGDIALFPLGRAGGEGAIHGHGRHRDAIAFESDHGTKYVTDESGRFGWNRETAGESAGNFVRHLDLVQVGQGLVHGGKVFLDDGFTALAVRFLDGLFDLADGFIARQDAGDGKEAGLHDGIHAAAHAGLFGHIVGIDGVEPELLLDDVFLDFLRQLIPDFIRTIQAVYQEDRARLAVLGEVKALQEGELVAGDEVGCVGCDQVGSLDRLGAKAQVRGGQSAGLLGVVVEIALGVIVGIFADDLDGVLVGADRTIRTQAKEEAANGLGMFNREVRVVVQAGSGSHLH